MAFRETQDHIMYNMCAKFYQNPCINLGGVGGTNLCLRTDRQTDGETDRLIPVYPPNFVAGGTNMANQKFITQFRLLKTNRSDTHRQENKFCVTLLFRNVRMSTGLVNATVWRSERKCSMHGRTTWKSILMEALFV
jgi:hypothetical protein